MPFKRIAPVADNLIDTLQAKVNALEELETLFERQLDALRDGDTDTLGEMTTKVQECAAILENARRQCERQARLLGRVLDEPEEATLGELIDALKARSDQSKGEQLERAHAAVKEQAQEVNQRSETLRFALQYASNVNHELLAAMKGAADEEGVHTYTAAGQAESRQPSGERSFVNTTG